MKSINVHTFYSNACSMELRIKKLIFKEDRVYYFKKCLDETFQKMAEGLSEEDISEYILQYLKSHYKREWFPFDWQFDQTISDDLCIIRRLFKWIGNRQVLKANLSIKNILKDELLVNSNVQLLLKSADEIHAVNVFLKRADKSFYGKSVHTHIENDLYALNAKLALDRIYPGIHVYNVYLYQEDDSPGNICSHFIVDKTRKSNVFHPTFSTFQTADGFNHTACENHMANIIQVPVEKRCQFCLHKKLCQIKPQDPPINRCSITTTNTNYQMPKYTAAQMEVIRHMDGPMLVCAGPGTGKTATLVGRIKHMKQSGIPSESMLCITFTREAAEELHKRCKSFCLEDDFPYIQTLHSLGLEITKKYGDFPKQPRLLTKLENMRILKGLLADSLPLSGFSYENLYGKQGLLSTVERKINSYFNDGEEVFFRENKTVGREFASFARRYQSIISLMGFISYDDQIKMAIQILKHNPDIHAHLLKKYKYVMVDEYQDIDSDQNEFIQLLAGHKNLVVVGDDDQSIYSFRGGSSQFMLDFHKTYPDAKRVILKENFRSTEAILHAAGKVIERNKIRIPKGTIAMKRGTNAPVFMEQTAEQIENLISGFLKAGYTLDDIAVLAQRNITLETMQASVSFPTVLGKSYLRNDNLFIIIKSILDCFSSDVPESWYCLLACFDMLPEEDILPKVPKSIQDVKWLPEHLHSLGTKLIYLFQTIETGSSAKKLIEKTAALFSYESSSNLEALMEFVENNNINEVEQLHEYMKYMQDFEDETRIQPDRHGKVLFLTSHEAKGMEFPIVIFLDDFDIQENDDSRRLYYVSLTRAKEYFFHLCKSGMPAEKERRTS